MCGRYALTVEPDALRRFIGLLALPPWEPRWNLAPSQELLLVVSAGGEREAARARWGFPNPRGGLLINARAETLFEKPAFWADAARRRCLIPASGFYEWERGGARRPWLFRPVAGGLLAFAGLWRPDADGRPARALIVTTAANATVGALHPRMPAILAPERWDAWLGAAPRDDLRALLVPAPGLLAATPLDGRVGDVHCEGPACWTPAVERQGRLF